MKTHPSTALCVAALLGGFIYMLSLECYKVGYTKGCEYGLSRVAQILDLDLDQNLLHSYCQSKAKESR
jgi:hypothetical protein